MDETKAWTGFSASAKVRKELGDVPKMKKAGFEQMFKVIFQSQVCVQAHTKFGHCG